MQLSVAMPPLSVLVIRNGRKYSDDAYLEFCEANPDLLVERNAEGEIVIVPPAGGESDYRNANAVMQLSSWALGMAAERCSGRACSSSLPMAPHFPQMR